MDGVVLALRDVPDQVFAQEMVGPGIAIDPQGTAVLSPAAGRVAAAHPHALAIELDASRAMLVHLGIDTVELGGQGFELHVAVGQDVAAGQLLVTWSPLAVVQGGRSALVPLIAVQASPGELVVLAAPGTAVRAGDPLLTWV